MASHPQVETRTRELDDMDERTPNIGDDVEAKIVTKAAGLEAEDVSGARGVTTSTWRVARSLEVLRDQADRVAPNRNRASDGTIGDPAHQAQGSASDHNPWVQDGDVGVVTALDLTHDPDNGCDGTAVSEAFRQARDARVKYVIFNRQIYFSYPAYGYPAWEWAPYSGDNPHTSHVHISVMPDKSLYDATTPWPDWGGPNPGSYGSFADPAFYRLWERTDRPIRDDLVRRTWLWGPTPLATGREEYDEGPGRTRLVQYFDKCRMEITNPDAPQDDWYVTNGLLVVEMISGRLQLGHNHFIDRGPAEEAVGGDALGGDYQDAPTYASFRNLATYPDAWRPAPNREGQRVTTVLRRDGSTYEDAGLASQNVIIARWHPDLQHNIPNVFWDFFPITGPVYENGRLTEGNILGRDWLFAIGLPISEPYWAYINVDRRRKWVLMQAFERRVLTYTPENPEGWRVEAGNVGLHYHQWRYGSSAYETSRAARQSPEDTRAAASAPSRTSLASLATFARYEGQRPYVWCRNETQTYRVTLVNQGQGVWTAGGSAPVRFQVGLESIDAPAAQTETTVNLPNDLGPGGRVSLAVVLKAPSRAGQYRLRERLIWGNDLLFDQIEDRIVTVKDEQALSLVQTLWRGNQQYNRYIPVKADDTLDWNGASGWRLAQTQLGNLPGAGDILAYDIVALPNGSVMESLWRSGDGRGQQGFYRLMPSAPDGGPDWTRASQWGTVNSGVLPAQGPVRSQSHFVFPNNTLLVQSFWIGQQGFWRTIALNNGAPDWTRTSSWTAVRLTTLPGAGDIQNQNELVLPDRKSMMQSVWRNDQGRYRIIPFNNGAPDWARATPWSEPISASTMIGSGPVQDQTHYYTRAFETTPRAFVDVPSSHFSFQGVEALFARGLVQGARQTDNWLQRYYKPEDKVSSGIMAIFLVRVKTGNVAPPPLGAQEFADVPPTHPQAAWINAAYRQGLILGCRPNADPRQRRFCPDELVTRARMAVFLLRLKYGKDYQPPAPTGAVFADVATNYWAAGWIEKLFQDGLTQGCRVSQDPRQRLFCPEDPVDRGQTAVFLARLKGWV